MTKKATIFIPVYNGENDHLNETLEAISRQKTDFDWDLFIIDSGSKDASVSIIKNYCSNHENSRMMEIPNSDYSHGETRQRAAELSEGEIMVYLSQDAIPADENWLKEMVEPFSISDDIVAVLGRQIPRSNCFPLQKQDINNVFNSQGIPGAVTLHDKYSNDLGRAKFYSDVCSAARRDILVSKIPYQSVNYAEDQAFGKDVIESNYIKAYTGKGAVIHSNDIRRFEYKGRIVDEYLGLKKAGVEFTKPKKRDLLNMVIRGGLQDMLFSLRDREYSKKQKFYFFITAPIYRYNRWKGIVEAYDNNANNSLENNKKRF
ncbi:MAG TPA: glycosyltransferase family 2 protein [Lactovum miscens]|uniref:glycosyltransferase family A protein n=1 Tax=Lactovum miscens TaxID=190387 RepID=UPI002ED7A65B